MISLTQQQLQRWLQGWAGLTNSRGSAQTQHPSVTGLCPAPPTPHGHLEGSGLALGSHRSSPVPKPAVQPSPCATGAAQPGGGCHCTSNRSVHTRRDKEGHSDGELTLSSPRLPAQLTPRSDPQLEQLHVLLNHKCQEQAHILSQQPIPRRATLCSAEPSAGSICPSFHLLILSQIPPISSPQLKHE